MYYTAPVAWPPCKRFRVLGYAYQAVEVGVGRDERAQNADFLRADGYMREAQRVTACARLLLLVILRVYAPLEL